jgi:hypothetical protein
VLGHHVTDRVFVLAREAAIYYQFLREIPEEMWNPRVIASGTSPWSWKEVAANSQAEISLAEVQEARIGRALDGRWGLSFLAVRSDRPVSTLLRLGWWITTEARTFDPPQTTWPDSCLPATSTLPS